MILYIAGFFIKLIVLFLGPRAIICYVTLAVNCFLVIELKQKLG